MVPEMPPTGRGHGVGPSTAGLRVDVVAGLTAAAVVLPKALAYATVAGLPVSVGLYTAFVPMLVVLQRTGRHPTSHCKLRQQQIAL